MARRSIWVGQTVTVNGIGGQWLIDRMQGVWVWVKPLDDIARGFAWLGENVVGFKASDLTPYLSDLGDTLL